MRRRLLAHFLLLAVWLAVALLPAAYAVSRLGLRAEAERLLGNLVPAALRHLTDADEVGIPRGAGNGE